MRKPSECALLVAMVALVALGVLGLPHRAHAAAWYDTGWAYRRAITVANPGATALANHQVQITLGNTFDFAAAKSDGSDLRLTPSDGTTTIPYWIESWDAGAQQAIVWARVPSIPAAGTTVYAYYANPGAASAGSGSATFEFFDDFESWLGQTTGWLDEAAMPTAIADQTAAVYNYTLYVFGGYSNGPADLQDKVYAYDPGTNAWTVRAPMPTPRWGMAAAEFNGLIYVFGGSATSGAGDIDKNEVYDPVANSWTSRAPIPSDLARQGVMAVKYGNRIHLFYESSHYEYDPATDTYTPRAAVPVPRFWCTSAVVGTKIYLIGGHHAGVANNDNQQYSPATDTWTTGTPLPVSLWGMTRDNPVINGKIYVTHGLDGSVFHASNYVYDPAADTWTVKNSGAHPRDGVACGVINNKLYVAGGRADFAGPYGLAYNEVYDPALDTGPPQAGPSLWATSGSSFVYADPAAKRAGNYGLVVEQTSDVATQRFAQSLAGFGSAYALDFDWRISDVGGVGTQPKPQGLVTLTEADPAGSLFYYNSSGTPVLRWYTGSAFDHLQNSTWNSWHRVSVVRNGAASRVVFDGNVYASPLVTAPPSGGTGRFKLGVYFATRQYLDDVRVRKAATVDPVASVGLEEPQPPPAAPVATAATNVAIAGFTANWGASAGATGYQLDVASDNLFASLLPAYSNLAVAGLSQAVSGLSASTPYYYRVRAVGAGGASASSNTITATTLAGDLVAAVVPPGTWITTVTPCVSVPVVLTRTGSGQARAVSVKLQLGPELRLCDPVTPKNSIHAGSWLAGYESSFQVIDRGNGLYQVDQAILGLPCGIATGGQLFTLDLTGSGADGTGALTVTAVTARDCDNGTLSFAPGAAAGLVVDRTPPGTVADLAVSPGAAGSSGRRKVAVAFTTPGDAAAVEVYRAPFGSYPLYERTPGTGAVPAAPTLATVSAAPWQRVSALAGPGSDDPGSRDYWYYAVVTRDAHGNGAISPPSAGALDYVLGDVHNGQQGGECTGDDAVTLSDISYLGASYGLAVPSDATYACLDVGPTTDYATTSRPRPDGMLDFEDLVLFALDFGTTVPAVPASPAHARPATLATAARTAGPAIATSTDALALQVPVLPGVGGVFDAAIEYEGHGEARAVSVELSYDPAVVQPVGVADGDLLASQASPHVTLSAHAGNVDVALLGGAGGLAGRGDLARVTFRVVGVGEAHMAVRTARARDAQNRESTLGGTLSRPAAPAATGLSRAMPTPFAGTTAFELSLARAGSVRLAVYGVNGRRIRTLASGDRDAGVYRVVWDGRDDDGRVVPPGMYFARLTARDQSFTRSLVRVR